MSDQKKNDVEVIDASDNDDDKPTTDKVLDSLTDEIKVFSKAAAVYFEKLSELHEESESNKKHSSLVDILTNNHKAQKAAWKHVVENSEAHKENERQAKRFMPKSAIDNLHDWLDD
ncbi:hypothetical protein Lepto7375DRAFT_0412 [Leptolyngbya sp. PCC 7375]|nr:hypothetical protein Lepto7375DRAFT_0412 [Leptolyngbya sp. PCC 7375]DAC80105.1 TPA_exp: hypothetical protein [Leptolyngbya sp. PCC 7375]